MQRLVQIPCKIRGDIIHTHLVTFWTRKTDDASILLEARRIAAHECYTKTRDVSANEIKVLAKRERAVP